MLLRDRHVTFRGRCGVGCIVRYGQRKYWRMEKTRGDAEQDYVGATYGDITIYLLQYLGTLVGSGHVGRRKSTEEGTPHAVLVVNRESSAFKVVERPRPSIV